MNRSQLTDSEKLAISMNPESELILANPDSRANMILTERKKDKFNEQVDNFNKRFEDHAEEHQKFAEKIAMNMNNVEISPVFGYVLIEPFKENPFQRMKTSASGLIYDLGGMTPEYKSEEDGQIHEEKQLVKVGTVVETGHTCEFVKTGDIVMYTVMSEVKVPFYNFGFVLCHEKNIMCVFNEKLTERKQNLKDGINE